MITITIEKDKHDAATEARILEIAKAGAYHHATPNATYKVKSGNERSVTGCDEKEANALLALVENITGDEEWKRGPGKKFEKDNKDKDA